MLVDPAFLAKISLFAPLDDDERAVLAQAMVDRPAMQRGGVWVRSVEFVLFATFPLYPHEPT